MSGIALRQSSQQMGVGRETKLSEFIAEDSIKKQLNQSKEPWGKRGNSASLLQTNAHASLCRKMNPARSFVGKHGGLWKGTGKSTHIPRQDRRDADIPQEQRGEAARPQARGKADP